MQDIDQLVQNCLAEIWRQYDIDDSGYLDKWETKMFVKNTLQEMGQKDNFTDADFEACFKEFDLDGSGTVSKDEMENFLRNVSGL